MYDFKRATKIFIRLTFLTLFFVSSVFFYNQDNVNASGISDFLCEIGVRFYDKGNYFDALHEFKKALIVDSDSEVAKKYIKLIREELNLQEDIPYPPVTVFSVDKKDLVSGKIIDRSKRISESIFVSGDSQGVVTDITDTSVSPRVLSKQIFELSKDVIKRKILQDKEKVPAQRYYQRLSLDVDLKAVQIQTRLELQIGRDLLITGRSIARFLVINPEILDIKRKGSHEVLVVAKKVGTTYFHLWDDDGRWTFTAHVSPFRPDRPTLAQLYRKQQEEAESFKLHYSNSWYSVNSGRRIDDTKRDSLSFYQNLGFDGQIPYGDLDGRVQFNKLKEETELTYYTLGLEDGIVGPFKGFDVRVFDYSVDFGNLVLGSESLRGAKLHSEAFQDKVNYTLFWGRENQGMFSPLSPGLAASEDSFVEGGKIGVNLTDDIYQTFSYVKGYGDARDADLRKDAYDYTSEIKFGNTKLRSDVAHDGKTLSYLLNSTYTIPKLQLTSEFRNIEEEFMGIMGRPYASGELGALFSYRYNPSTNAEFSGRLNTYRDRLFPNPEHDDRFNVDFDSSFRYVFNPATSVKLDYYNNHDTGTISPHKYESMGASLYKRINFIKKLSTYLSFRHQRSDSVNSSTSDYTNEKLSFGLRFSLTKRINYFLMKEFNWLEEYTGDTVRPHVFETGIDYSTQVYETPFYITSRLFFRDEENTESSRSFLSGEDSFETQGELRYQPSDDFNAFLNLRVNNIWAENPDTTKRLEAEVRLGTRWTFDTGLRWNPIGSIAGIVFKDLNSDGVYQIKEPSIKGVKIMLGEEKHDITDSEGMYLFEDVRAKKVFLSIDTSSLPSGFVLTSSAFREVEIEHGKIVSIDFGIISRSEIYGIIFNDINGNGKFDSKDKGIGDVVLSIEDGTKVSTNDKGQYYFRGISPGDHKITVDINSIPVNFIPQTSLFKDVKLFEGMTYVHSIPLKEVKKE